MRVLVVEDEYYLAADLAEALAARGVQVIGPVGTLADAVTALEDHTIDRAVLDMNLQGEMSFPIADRLEAAGIPYVVATGYAAEMLPDRFRNRPRLEKPYRPDMLVSMLELENHTSSEGG